MSGAALRFESPMELDLLAAEGAVALSQAIGVRKVAARRLGRSVDVLDKYLAGNPCSPIFRFDQLLLVCDHPFALLTHVKIVVQRIALRRKTTLELVERFNRIMSELEPVAECGENQASQGYYAKGDLLALADADEKEAALQEERAAIARELHRRNADPRRYPGL